MPPTHSRAPLAALALALAVLPACRESDNLPSNLFPIVPNANGANGCATPNNAFSQGLTSIALSTLSVGPFSQVSASLSGPILYATGADATLVAIDLGNPGVPVETLLLAPGDVAALLASFGITEAPRLSGVAVLNPAQLVVMEHTANVLLSVDRELPGSVALLAGMPSVVPGFADSPQTSPPMPELARFSFDTPCQVLPTGMDGSTLYVVDSGNDAIRLVTGGQVLTLAGLGTPLTADGPLQIAGFDTPSGVTATCEDTLLISELGDAGGGQRIRSMFVIAPSPFFPGLDGDVTTLVGTGMAATTDGVLFEQNVMANFAQVDRPSSPLATFEGDVYWVDTGTGVLRRLRDDFVDCPLAVDCATAVQAPSFTPGATQTLTQTPDGTIYVLDNGAGVLYRLPN